MVIMPLLAGGSDIDERAHYSIESRKFPDFCCSTGYLDLNRQARARGSTNFRSHAADASRRETSEPGLQARCHTA